MMALKAGARARVAAAAAAAVRARAGPPLLFCCSRRWYRSFPALSPPAAVAGAAAAPAPGACAAAPLSPSPLLLDIRAAERPVTPG